MIKGRAREAHLRPPGHRGQRPCRSRWGSPRARHTCSLPCSPGGAAAGLASRRSRSQPRAAQGPGGDRQPRHAPLTGSRSTCAAPGRPRRGKGRRNGPARCGLCPESSPSAAAGSAASEPARPASSRGKATTPARSEGLQPPPQGAPRVHHPAQPPGSRCGGHVVFYVPGA